MDYVIRAVGKALDSGFTMVKLHQHPDDAIDAIRAIREGFGYDLRVALDVNAAFNDPQRALDFLSKVHRYEPYWVEEPTWPPNDYELLGIVANKSPVPIAAGENEYYIGGFRELARLGLAYVQPDISKVGGLLRFIEVVKAVNGLGKSVTHHTIGPINQY